MHILLALLASLALLIPGTGVVASGMIDRDDAPDTYEYDLDDRGYSNRGGDWDDFFELDLAERDGSDLDIEDVFERNFHGRGNQQNQNAQDQNGTQRTQPDQDGTDTQQNQDGTGTQQNQGKPNKSQRSQQNQNGTDTQQDQGQQNQDTTPTQPDQSQSSGASYSI